PCSSSTRSSSAHSSSCSWSSNPGGWRPYGCASRRTSRHGRSRTDSVRRRMKLSRLIRMVAVLGVVAVVAAACGGTSKTTGGAKGTLAAAPGFDPAAKTIHVGVITPLTGIVAAIGKPLTAGTETYFKYVNQEKGGIAGKYKVVLDEEDSQYVPQLGVQAYNKIKGNDVLIAQLLGTPVTKAVLPLLQSDNVVAAPASLDADWVAEQNL